MEREPLDAPIPVIERWQARVNACEACKAWDGMVFFQGEGPHRGPPPYGLHYGCNCRRRVVDTSLMAGTRLIRLAREAKRNGQLWGTRSVSALELARRG